MLYTNTQSERERKSYSCKTINIEESDKIVSDEIINEYFFFVVKIKEKYMIL